MSVMIDLADLKFGRLLVLRRGKSTSAGNIRWLCKCDCGKRTLVMGVNLRTGHTVSCGCLHSEVTRSVSIPAMIVANTIHGLSGSVVFRARKNALSRCKSDNPNYGGRGIRMCRRWKRSANAFLKDLYSLYRPGLTIDRIDNDGHYSCGKCKQCRRNGWPMNVRWATRLQQTHNRRTSGA